MKMRMRRFSVNAWSRGAYAGRLTDVLAVDGKEEKR